MLAGLYAIALAQYTVLLPALVGKYGAALMVKYGLPLI